MLVRLERYRYAAEMHRKAIKDLPQKEAITVADKQRLGWAYEYGKWGTIAVQFPCVYFLYRLNKQIEPMPVDKKVISYVFLTGAYGISYMLTKAWVWHQVFSSVEDIIHHYVESVTVEDLQKIEEERRLGILKEEKDKVYIPKE